MEILKEAIRKNIEFYGYPYFKYDTEYGDFLGIFIPIENGEYLFKAYGSSYFRKQDGTTDYYDLPFISTGELFNHMVKFCYELGKE